jgi:phospholipid-binding lipoprotein MlaA
MVKFRRAGAARETPMARLSISPYLFALFLLFLPAMTCAGSDSSSPEPGFAEEPFPQETPPPALADPLEPLNRVLFVVNDKAYFWVMKPVAKGYRAVVPEVVRLSVRNFFANIAMPIRVVNNLLQGKIRNSGVELLRFAINTTAGIGGLFDPAKNDFHLDPRDEDLGQTFGKYGLGHGLYLVLPILGPSSLRDAAGLAGDFFLDPVNNVGDTEVLIGAKALKSENEVSLRIGEYEDLTKSALDPYVAVRDAYSQYRAKKVKE